MSRAPVRLALLAAVVLGAYGLAASGPPPASATVDVATSHAFSRPLPGLDAEAQERHRAGNRLFEATFVTGPAPVHAGLGPVFNRNSCAACHARDGRTPGVVVLRVSVPGPNGTPAPAPGFGFQVQDRAVVGSRPEARVNARWTTQTVRLADGTAIDLRRPSYRLAETAAPVPAGLLVSPRAPRAVFGLGLLESVPDAALHALAAEQARAGVVSGRVNTVWDPTVRQTRAGRFGHKATHATVLSQTAAAFTDDVGVTTPWSAGRRTPEVSEDDARAVADYVRTLAVPSRRRPDTADVRRGERLFDRVGCAACHVPRLTTGAVADVPALGRQPIAPYSDLLLHDMGPGLADGRPDRRATGREWRTAPLWGLGLAPVVNGRTELLHDGRARTPTEAVLWHGGEASTSRRRFTRLSAADRDALLAFLQSL